MLEGCPELAFENKYGAWVSSVSGANHRKRVDEREKTGEEGYHERKSAVFGRTAISLKLASIVAVSSGEKEPDLGSDGAEDMLRGKREATNEVRRVQVKSVSGKGECRSLKRFQRRS